MSKDRKTERRKTKDQKTKLGLVWFGIDGFEGFEQGGGSWGKPRAGTEKQDLKPKSSETGRKGHKDLEDREDRKNLKFAKSHKFAKGCQKSQRRRRRRRRNGKRCVYGLRSTVYSYILSFTTTHTHTHTYIPTQKYPHPSLAPSPPNTPYHPHHPRASPPPTSQSTQSQSQDCQYTDPPNNAGRVILYSNEPKPRIPARWAIWIAGRVKGKRGEGGGRVSWLFPVACPAQVLGSS